MKYKFFYSGTRKTEGGGLNVFDGTLEVTDDALRREDWLDITTAGIAKACGCKAEDVQITSMNKLVELP